VKRVVIVPASDIEHFPDLEVIARDGALVALVGNTAAGRTRDAYESEESFLNAVAQGFADRHTFNSLSDAAAFAVAKLDNLAQIARGIEAAMQQRSTPRPQPERHTNGLSGTVQWKKDA
jgi:hypothetical protein